MEEVEAVSCEHLLCAACGGPVVEGRCPACRAARARVHRHNPLGLSPFALAVLAMVLLALLLIVQQVRP
jgi:hypothetical protein